MKSNFTKYIKNNIIAEGLKCVCCDSKLAEGRVSTATSSLGKSIGMYFPIWLRCATPSCIAFNHEIKTYPY